MSLRSANNEITEIFKFFYGTNSPLNFFGKIMLTPFILVLAIVWYFMELLFSK